MRNKDRDPSLYENDLEPRKDLYLDSYKTTNVNILLNRVRLDQKRTLKKRIVFSIIIACLVSSLAIYFNV